MVKRIQRIGPYQAGRTAAVVCGLFSLLIAPLLALPSLFGSEQAPPVWFAVLIVPVYVFGGFLNGICLAAVYNLAAGWVGGIEVVVEDQAS